MKISLHSFCKDHDLAKSTVHRRCQEMDIDTTDGLSPDDCDRLRAEFGIRPTPSPVSNEFKPSIKGGEIVPYEKLELDLPKDFDLDAALSTFDDVQIEAFDDSEKVVDAVEVLLNRVRGGLETTIQKREQKVKADRTQLHRLELIQEDFDRTVAAVKHKSKGLETEQNHLTGQLQQAYQKVVELGKPRDGDSD